MAIASMTGYARAEGSEGTVSFVWEARSVNGRTLETRLRVPPGYERLEHPARVFQIGSGFELRRGFDLSSDVFPFRRVREADGKVFQDGPCATGNVVELLNVVGGQGSAQVVLERDQVPGRLLLVFSKLRHRGLQRRTRPTLIELRLRVDQHVAGRDNLLPLF